MVRRRGPVADGPYGKIPAVVSVATLEVSRLTRTFRTGREVIRALEDIDLEVDAGEIVGVLGLNGAGKTTMLKVVSTLLLPSGGTVRVGGHDVVRETGAARRLLSVIFGGDRGLYLRLSGRDNVRFFGTLSGLSRREVAARVDPALEQVGLAQAASRPVETYSRGMRQRLHLAIGLLSTPRLLMLDEPTIGLDPLEAERLRGSIAALRGSGTAVLLTSHYLGDIERLAGRIVVLERGRVTHDLPLARLLERAGAAAEVALTGRGPAPPLDGEAREGIRLLRLTMGTPTPETWTITFEVKEWAPASLRELASLWPEAEVTDVRVLPVSLEQVFSELARRAT